MGIKFNNPEVEAQFETDKEKDGIVHLPGGKQRGAGWKGMFSNLPLTQAERWINRPGQTLLRRKAASAQPPAGKKKAEEKGE